MLLCLQIGDVVLVHDESGLYEQDLDGRLGFVDPVGLDVRTRAGEFLGKVGLSPLLFTGLRLGREQLATCINSANKHTPVQLQQQSLCMCCVVGRCL